MPRLNIVGVSIEITGPIEVSSIQAPKMHATSAGYAENYHRECADILVIRSLSGENFVMSDAVVA